jgi:hypothetical protein
MPMKMVAADAMALDDDDEGWGELTQAKASSRAQADQDDPYEDLRGPLPYWPNLKENGMNNIGSAPLDPRSDKRKNKRPLAALQDGGNTYHVTLNITGDVNAGLSLFTKDASGAPQADL